MNYRGPGIFGDATGAKREHALTYELLGEQLGLPGSMIVSDVFVLKDTNEVMITVEKGEYELPDYPELPEDSS